MVPEKLELRMYMPSRHTLSLDDTGRKLWQDIQFHEESGDWAAADKVWEDLLSYYEDDIVDRVLRDMHVEEAHTA